MLLFGFSQGTETKMPLLLFALIHKTLCMRHFSKHVCHLRAQFPLSGQDSIGPSQGHSWHSPRGCSGGTRVLEKLGLCHHSGVTPFCWGGEGCSWSHSLLLSLVPIKCMSNHPTQAFKAMRPTPTHADGVYLVKPWTAILRCPILAFPWVTSSNVYGNLAYLTWPTLGFSCSHSCQGKAEIRIFMILLLFTHYVIIKSPSQLIVFHNDYWLFLEYIARTRARWWSKRLKYHRVPGVQLNSYQAFLNT